MNALQDIVVEKNDSGSLCFTIQDISDELKLVIRERLSKICYGAARASRRSVIYSYKSTLTAFLKKFETKSLNIQKGMIGELLTHVLFLHYEEGFRAASAYFNLEEDSIKKGFDLVLFDDDTSEIWLAEVKAGDCGDETTIQKLGDLLSLAKNDLKTKLNSERNTLWQNAINGAIVVTKDASLKDQIETVLEYYTEKVVAGTSTSADYNVILFAVCFPGAQPFATSVEFDARHATQKAMNEFRNLMSVALQKDTIQSVIDFLQSEIENV